MNIKSNLLAVVSFLLSCSILAILIFSGKLSVPSRRFSVLLDSAFVYDEMATWHDDMIYLHNAYRIDNGLEPLRENEVLNEIAKEKAHHLMENCYWSHEYDGKIFSFESAKKDRRYNYIVMGENLGKDVNSLQELFKAWTLSNAHNGVILERGNIVPYTEIGTYTYPSKFWCYGGNGEVLTLDFVSVVLFGTEAQ